MKAFLLLVLLVVIALVAVNRRRIYVRDPLAAVTITNARQSGKSGMNQSGQVRRASKWQVRSSPERQVQSAAEQRGQPEPGRGDRIAAKRNG